MTATSSAAPEAAHSHATFAGVICGAGAGALWGLVFLAPELVRTFDPLFLTSGRYLFYGLISAAMLATRWRHFAATVSAGEWLALMKLGFTGNILYYLLLSTAVQSGGVAMTSLVIGFLPVAVTIVGSRDKGAISLAKLAPSLLLCAAGAICIGWQTVAAPSQIPASARLAGLLSAIGALVSWTIYAVSNSRWLRRLDHISAHDWNFLTGVVTGAQSLVLIPLAFLIDHAHHDATEWTQLGLVSLGVAFLASIVGNALWNRMSRLLPLTLTGQMILFETLFALIYGFLWERRLPHALETAAFTLVALSVVSCVGAHRNAGAQAQAADAVHPG
ncbi:DMT family transporter [Acetobacter sacchari]|uniref:DMT family transporter n=1 Tax=Acetobacter sacchari TaxID=2661687 RepID=A0ABS3LR05_9PROT|nr:DMT family transporter [Acetobacter sacchari]MBO1358338.1 DMT family transporter [Acetobacter sacchari]